MKIIDEKGKSEELLEEKAILETEVAEPRTTQTDIAIMKDSAMNDLKKVNGTSGDIQQQSSSKAFFNKSKNIRDLAENDKAISRVLKNILDWLLLVTNASTIRRDEYEDLTNQMLQFEADSVSRMEMQVKFKRAFEQLQKDQRDYRKLLKMRVWLKVSIVLSIVAVIIAIIALII
ncbi:MAG: hypothetical protein ACI4FZ_03010 [Lachnospiraceae bacterium]